MLVAILEQSLVFLPFAMGVYLSYGILKKADLTVDGSIVLGAGVYAKCLLLGTSPIVATIAAVLCGALCGLFTALIQYREKIAPLVAGILTLFILQSVNLLVMGRPNLNILHYSSFIGGHLGLLVVSSALLLLVVFALMKSRVGILLRAFGCNAQLLEQLGKSSEGYRMLGLAISNALVAYSGTLMAQSNGFADIGMGVGLVLVGIGMVILGQQMQALIQHKVGAVLLPLVCVSMGAVIYFSVVQSFASLGLNPIYLKMLIGLTLVGVLLLQAKRGRVLV